MYLREIVQLCLVAISLWFGSQQVRDANLFTYGAIIEVAALFVGIFICMQPALQILAIKGSELGLATPAHFFWATGSLSSVLDNAPTYLVFFKTAQSLPIDPNVTAGRRRRPAASGRDQLGLGVHGRDDVHRQRPEFHGPLDRRVVGRENAELLRLHGLQLRDPAADFGADGVAVS